MARWQYLVLGAGVVGAAAFWILTKPVTLDPERFANLTPDVDRGAMVYAAAGCGACHMAPEASGDQQLVLTGGMAFPSPFGTFRAPNISNDPTHGIGGWSTLDLANAVMAGVSPDGQHYYPAFPWDSYRHMAPQDLVDLHEYLKTLPASDQASQPHDLPLPFQLRRGIGLWKLAFARDGWVIPTESLTSAEQRGQYLVESLGHCAECHTPRAVTGQLDQSRWLAGSPSADGQGGIPNITPSDLEWTDGEIVEYLTSGFTPDYDSAGGHMALVVANYAKLPIADRQAVAAYLKKVPSVE